MTSSPILVSSPTTRSGTTLLQRLITSSENGICYGETCGRRIINLCEFAHTEIVNVQNNQDRQAYEWNNILEENYDYWMVGLDLPAEFPTHSLAGAVQFFRQSYDEATQAIEKDIWAVKVPNVSFQSVVKTADLISDLKCIYIYRNVYDVLRSQKSRGWVTDLSQIVKGCTEWIANTEVIVTLKRNQFENLPAMLHVIEYEDLTEHLQENIDRIEDFTKLTGIKPEVADTKINTWEIASKTNFEPEVSYTPPQSLSHQECEIIDKICGERMRELYPDLQMERYLAQA